MSPTGVPPRVAPPEVPVLTEVVLPARPDVMPPEPPPVAGVSGALPAAEAVAVAVPDAKLGEKVGLAVVLRPGHQLTLDELNRHLRDVRKVAVFKLPEYLKTLDALPTMASGKTDIHAIRALLRAEAATD